MDIQKLTKKNQEFIHIATNQLIKDGKSDQEIKDILDGVPINQPDIILWLKDYIKEGMQK